MDAPLPTRQRARVLRRTMTLPKVLLWLQLKGRKLGGLHFRKQHPLGPYVLDFYCAQARLAVEVDGYVHGVGDQPARDERRDAYLANLGLRTLRLPAAVVLEDMDAALRTIAAAAAVELRKSSPSGGGGVRAKRRTTEGEASR